MNFILWLILGLVAGWLASLIMKTDRSQGALMDIIFGIVGSMVGGFAMNFFGQAGVTGFNLYSVMVSTIGAVIVIAVGRALSR